MYEYNQVTMVSPTDFVNYIYFAYRKDDLDHRENPV